MFPSLPIFSRFSLSFEHLLLACGVLAALATVERLAPKLRLRSDRLWNAAVLAGVTVFAGERLLLLIHGWRDFAAHPFAQLFASALQILRPIVSPEPALFYAGAALALLCCTLYLVRHRVPLLRAADALLPGLGVLLAFQQASYFAAGAEPGRITSPRWGIVSTDPAALALYGTPLHVPLLPVAAWASLCYAAIALIAVGMAARGRSTSGFFLLMAGLVAVLLGQLHRPGEPMLLGIFTWAQTTGVLSTFAGACLLLSLE